MIGSEGSMSDSDLCLWTERERSKSLCGTLALEGAAGAGGAGGIGLSSILLISSSSSGKIEDLLREKDLCLRTLVPPVGADGGGGGAGGSSSMSEMDDLF